MASRVLRLAGVRIVFEPGCMATSPIDATWKEAVTFLRRQFLIGRCYAPMWWWATVPLMILQPLVLFGGIAWAGFLAKQGNANWFLPLLASGSLYALTVLRGDWRQTVWKSRIQRCAWRVARRQDSTVGQSPWSCLFTAGVLLMSAAGRSITWRGIHYHIGAAGRITLIGRIPDEQQRREMLAANHRRCEQEEAARLAAASVGKTGAARQVTLPCKGTQSTASAELRRVA